MYVSDPAAARPSPLAASASVASQHQSLMLRNRVSAPQKAQVIQHLFICLFIWLPWVLAAALGILTLAFELLVVAYGI